MNNRGVTIVELVVVLAVFSLVIVTTISIFTLVVDRQRVLLSENEILNQTNSDIDYISRVIRMAVNDTDGSCLGAGYKGDDYILTHKDSGSGFYQGIKVLSSYDGLCHEFYLTTADGILKSNLKGSVYNILYSGQSNKFSINYARFVINGDKTISDDKGVPPQPRITLALDLSIRAGSGIKNQVFQTTVSRANLDLFNRSKYLYVVNYNSNTLQKFNSSDLSLANDVGTDSSPDAVAVSRDGKYVYVANCIGQSLQKFNASDLSLAGDIKTGACLYSVAVSYDGKYVYTTGGKYNSSDLSLVQAGGNLIDHIVVSSDGNYVYSSSKNDTGIKKINASDLSLAKEIYTNSYDDPPIAVYPDGTYVYGGGFLSTLFKYNSSDMSLVKSYRDFYNNVPATAMSIFFNGNYLYVVYSVINHLEKYNSSDLNPQIASGGVVTDGYPLSVGVSSDGKYVYVVNNFGNNLQKFNSSDLSMVKKVSTDNGPYSIAVSP